MNELRELSPVKSHWVISPVVPVANSKKAVATVRLVIVCTPSFNVKASGVTKVSDIFGVRGAANVTIAVTKSLVVYGPPTWVNGLPVYWYVVGTACTEAG